MKHKKFKTPQIVIFKQPPKGYENAYPWKPNQSLLFLGEIANMPGHCVIVDRRGKVYWVMILIISGIQQKTKFNKI